MLTARVPLSSVVCPEQDAEVCRAVFFPRDCMPLFGTLTVVSRNRGVETGNVVLVANQPSDLDALIRCATELRDMLVEAAGPRDIPVLRSIATPVAQVNPHALAEVA